MDKRTIKKVHVVFKTHLDVGFTDLSANIINKYDQVFIPKAIDTAEKLNTDGKTRFIWTVGSYIIDHHLRTATASERARLECAIERGWITWHALPCTTHTELMSACLFRNGVEISHELDRRFGCHTVAAKMTDVPGHTVSLVPLLEAEGVRYLHIGVNDASRLPGVPKVFRWRRDGKEILVQYAAHYGETAMVEGMEEALVFMHAHDNEGPPTPEEVLEFFAQLQTEFPNAEIVGSTLNAYAEALEPLRDTLPIVTGEIGDTWIHGGATDPGKMGAFERLLELHEEWEKNSPAGYQEARGDFIRALLLIPEHTWGMDTKKYLYDYQNWKKKDFQRARCLDVIPPEAREGTSKQIQETIQREAVSSTGEMRGSYSLFEQSHEEQRAYLGRAINALPERLAAQALTAITQNMAIPDCTGKPVQIGERLELHGWGFRLLEDGSVLLDDGLRAGAFFYQNFDGQITEACYRDYNRDQEETGGWSRPDFAKPGLERLTDVQAGDYAPKILKAVADENGLTVHLACDAAASELYGCPRKLFLRYEAAAEEFRITLIWKDKDASRIPEALWLGVYPKKGEQRVQVKKLDRWVSPLEVLPGGNRALHGCRAVRIGNMELTCPDAPVISVGGRRLYDVSDALPEFEKGIHFLLFNNRWGTNFKMWYEEDARFDLLVRKASC